MAARRLSPVPSPVSAVDDEFAKLLSKDEDQLLEFVAKVNKVFEQKLKKEAPFMTFVLCGMQSSGKSTIMERFMNAVTDRWGQPRLTTQR